MTNRGGSRIVVALCVGVCGAQGVAHEVSVHQRLSHAAAKGAERLNAFLEEFELTDETLMDPGSVEFLVSSAMGVGVFASNVDFLVSQDGTPYDLIRIGSILEDRGTRFCNHFYTPTSADDGDRLRFSGFGDTVLRYICAGLESEGEATPPHDARTWALTATNNKDGWTAALERYYTGMTALTSDDRKEALAELFIGLGHIIHLVQDLSQPSHTRNDSHACLPGNFGQQGPHGCSAFETWFNRVEHRDDVDEIAGVGFTSSEFAVPGPTFAEMANFSARNFFSDDTLFAPSVFGEVPVRFDAGFIVNTQLDEAALAYFGPMCLRSSFPPIVFIESQDDAELHPECGTLRNVQVLLDNAQHLYPPAIEHSIEVLNYFFRATIEARIVDVEALEEGAGFGTVRYVIENVSDTPTLEGFSTLLDVSGIELRAIKANGDSLPLTIIERSNTTVLMPGDTMEVAVRYPKLEPGIMPDRRTLVVYRGGIGEENGSPVPGVTAAIAKLTDIRLLYTGWGSDGGRMDDAWAECPLLPSLEERHVGEEWDDCPNDDFLDGSIKNTSVDGEDGWNYQRVELCTGADGDVFVYNAMWRSAIELDQDGEGRKAEFAIASETFKNVSVSEPSGFEEFFVETRSELEQEFLYEVIIRRGEQLRIEYNGNQQKLWSTGVNEPRGVVELIVDLDAALQDDGCVGGNLMNFFGDDLRPTCRSRNEQEPLVCWPSHRDDSCRRLPFGEIDDFAARRGAGRGDVHRLLVSVRVLPNEINIGCVEGTHSGSVATQLGLRLSIEREGKGPECGFPPVPFCPEIDPVDPCLFIDCGQVCPGALMCFFIEETEEEVCLCLP